MPNIHSFVQWFSAMQESKKVLFYKELGNHQSEMAEQNCLFKFPLLSLNGQQAVHNATHKEVISAIFPLFSSFFSLSNSGENRLSPVCSERLQLKYDGFARHSSSAWQIVRSFTASTASCSPLHRTRFQLCRNRRRC